MHLRIVCLTLLSSSSAIAFVGELKLSTDTASNLATLMPSRNHIHTFI